MQLLGLPPTILAGVFCPWGPRARRMQASCFYLLWKSYSAFTNKTRIWTSVYKKFYSGEAFAFSKHSATENLAEQGDIG